MGRWIELDGAVKPYRGDYVHGPRDGQKNGEISQRCSVAGTPAGPLLEGPPDRQDGWCMTLGQWTTVFVDTCQLQRGSGGREGPLAPLGRVAGR